MKIYFGHVKAEVAAQSMHDGVSLFAVDEDYFDYCIDADSETVRIVDSIGRMVPLCHTDIKDLRKALKILDKGYSRVLEKHESIVDALNTDLEIYISNDVD